MIEVIGKHGVSAKMVLHSVSESGIHLPTFEITYPGIILRELNTHRALPKNSASSRAIPFEKMKQQLTGRPVRFGAANKGMQDKGEHDALVHDPAGDTGNPYTREEAWEAAKIYATMFSEAFYKAGYAKQVFNRLTEPFQMMKTIISGTEWANFFWLRRDEMADPTFKELTDCIYEAYKQSTPQVLKPGEWHLPFVDFSNCYVNLTSQGFYIAEPEGPTFISLEQAIKVSCARAAAVSFRNTNYGLEKCNKVYSDLLEGKIHGSALEHCATPIQDIVYYSGIDHYGRNDPAYPCTWENGISHVDREGNFWSGPLRGWVQHRKTIPNENYTGEF